MERPLFNEASTEDYACAADAASCFWGAHLHTFSSPEQSPVKRGPPSASSMVLTSLLEKRVPTSWNLKDAEASGAPFTKEDAATTGETGRGFFQLTMEGRAGGCGCCYGGSRAEQASSQHDARRIVCVSPATESEMLELL